MPAKWPEINPNEVATIWQFIFLREIFLGFLCGLLFYKAIIIYFKISKNIKIR